MSTETVAVDIISSSEDELVCVSSLKKRSAPDVDEENGEEEEEEEEEVVIIDKTECILSFSSRRPRKKKRGQIVKTTAPDDDDGDDDCCVLASPPSATRSDQLALTSDNVEELVVTGETGPVACRDFPHARYLCVQFPFKTTDPVNCCNQCHCYVCDILAPCENWLAHCRANDRDECWKSMRKTRKNGLSPALPSLQFNVQVNVSAVQSNTRFRPPSPLQSNVRPHGQQQQHRWTMADYALGTVPPRAATPVRAVHRPSGSGYLKVWTNEPLQPGRQPPTTGRGRPKKQPPYTGPLTQFQQSVPPTQATQAPRPAVNHQAPRLSPTVSRRFQLMEPRVSSEQDLRPVSVVSNPRVPCVRGTTVTPARRPVFRPVQPHSSQTPGDTYTRTQGGASTRTQATGEVSTRTQGGASTRTQAAGEASTRTQAGEAPTMVGEAFTKVQTSEGHPKKTRSVSGVRQLRRASQGQPARVRNTSSVEPPSQPGQAGRDRLSKPVPAPRYQLRNQARHASESRNQKDGEEPGQSESNTSVRQCNSGSTSEERGVPRTFPVPGSHAQVSANGAASGNDLAGPNHEQCYTNMQTGEVKAGLTDLEYLTELEALLELSAPTGGQ